MKQGEGRRLTFLYLFSHCENIYQELQRARHFSGGWNFNVDKINTLPTLTNLREISWSKISCKPSDIFALSLCIASFFIFPQSLLL